MIKGTTSEIETIDDLFRELFPDKVDLPYRDKIGYLKSISRSDKIDHILEGSQKDYKIEFKDEQTIDLTIRRKGLIQNLEIPIAVFRSPGIYTTEVDYVGLELKKSWKDMKIKIIK